MDNTETGKTLIHLERDFPCPVEPLFEAFLSAEEFRNWFSPPGLEAGDFSLDPVVGGRDKCEFLKQGKYVLTIKGIYIEIERYKKLVFTLEYDPDVSEIGECKVTISFSSKGNTASIVLNQEIFKSIEAEGRTKGWNYMFSRLEETLIKKQK